MSNKEKESRPLAMQFVRNIRNSPSAREQVRVAAVLAAAAICAFLFIFGLRRVIVGERVYRADYPVPARSVDAVVDRFLIRDVREALAYHLQHTTPELCGLSAIHLGLPVQVAMMRRYDGSKLYFQNPKLRADEYTEWDDAYRMLGGSDPLCRRSTLHFRNFRVARKIWVTSEGEAPRVLTDGDARCAQQLLWSLHMNSSDDWPCELSRWQDVEYLPLYFPLDV